MDFTALVLAQHVRQSALVSATCHDVTLVAFNRRYRLHRIFLVQSSFFSSLLQGGFSEGARFRPPRGNYSNDADSLADDGSSHNGGNVLHLTFDDPNITRPAFEYSIALLYGAHPELVLPPWARPSPGNPLSSAWPPNFDVADDSMTAQRQHIASSSVPPGSKMPATPRFLISLLATSIYLGIPSLTASTLTLIQSSFTPYTISTYMRFALGQPIVGAGSSAGDDVCWDWELEGPCWGFDRIGEWLGDEVEEEDDDDVRFVSERTQGMAFDGSAINIKREGQGGLADVVDDDDDEADDGGGRSISPLRRAKQQDTSNPSISVSSDSSKSATLDPSMASTSSSLAALASATAAAASADSPATGSAILSPAFSPVTPALDYGPLSHRIGEACFCYLSRWGGEIAAEEQDKWIRDETRLEELVQQMDKHHSQQLRLVCEATTAYCLPRGQLPALLEVENSRSTDWDIPTPPLCVFSHPSLSHRAVMPGEAKPYPYDSERPGLSTYVYGFDTDSDADGDESAQQQQQDDSADFGAVSSLGMASSHLVDLLGSDAFFARSELERYEIAKDIVAMRRAQKSVAAAIVMTRGSGGNAAESDDDDEARSSLPTSQPPPPMTRARRSRLGTGAPATPSTPRGGGRSGKERDRMDLDESTVMDIDVEEVDADDEHYARLFREGIYYSHLSFADLKRISQEAAAAASSTSDEDDDDEGHGSNLVDRSSTKNIYASSFWARAKESRKKQTIAPAAPLETLQAALWAGNELKNHILSSANVSDPALEAAQPVLSPEGIRRGLAYTAEGSSLDTSMAGMASSASGSGLANTTAPGGGKSTGPGNAATADVDESLLGISSPLRHFATALKQQADRRRATGLSRSSTPLSPMGTPSRAKQQQQHHQRAPSSLGGLTFSSPLAGTSSSSSSSSLLSKRYFSVPVDDTIRYGEFFAGLLTGAAQAAAAAAQNVGSSFAAATMAAAQPPVLGDQHSHEATGLAAMRDQNTLATMPGGSLATNPSGVNAPGSSSAAAAAVAATAGGPADPLLSQLGAVLVGGPFSDAKRSRANLYGLRNKLCKGKALGKVAAQVASRRAAERREGEEDRDLNDDEEESASAVPTKTLNDAPADSTDNASGLGGANASHGGFLLGRLERRHWTGYEPMRVGVEYYGLDLLEEKQRLYSPSFFYAGSVWNLYVQTARKPRGMQLGVYLHRQSPNEPLPPASAPPEEVGLYQNHQAAEAGAQAAPAPAASNTSSFLPGAPRRRGAHIIHNAGAGGSSNVNTTTWRSMNRNHGAGSTLGAGPGPPVLPGVSPPIPYRDPRKMVRVYFSIHCHSPLGNSLTRFDSGPDRFSESQSWGWKSSSLMGIWELEGGKLSGGRGEASDGFRCVVTLGVV